MSKYLRLKQQLMLKLLKLKEKLQPKSPLPTNKLKKLKKRLKSKKLS
jgi:hypothetical protein